MVGAILTVGGSGQVQGLGIVLAVVSAAEPVVSVPLSVAVLGETVGPIQGLGIVMVIGAVLLACRTPAGQPTLSPVPPG